MSSTYTLTLNVTSAGGAPQDLLADLLRTIDAHCPVQDHGLRRLPSAGVTVVRVRFSAASDVEAGAISRDALSAAPTYVSRDAERLTTGTGTRKRAVAIPSAADLRAARAADRTPHDCAAHA